MINQKIKKMKVVARRRQMIKTKSKRKKIGREITLIGISLISIRIINIGECNKIKIIHRLLISKVTNQLQVLMQL